MKKTLLALTIIPFFVLIAAFKPASTIVQFAAADWENSKSRAMAEGKLYFVDSYCFLN